MCIPDAILNASDISCTLTKQSEAVTISHLRPIPWLLDLHHPGVPQVPLTAACVLLQNCRAEDLNSRIFLPPPWALSRVCIYKGNPPVSGLVPPKSQLPLSDFSHMSNNVSKGQFLQMRVIRLFLLPLIFGLSSNTILLLSSSFTCPFI